MGEALPWSDQEINDELAQARFKGIERRNGWAAILFFETDKGTMEMEFEAGTYHYPSELEATLAVYLRESR